MIADGDFDEINEAKACMGHICNEPDPRAYFRELEKLRYAIPGAAKPIFEKLISFIRRRHGEPVCMLDLGCSYGVNAALLKHDLTMPELYDHWGQERLDRASPEEVIEYDKRFFTMQRQSEGIDVIGIDQSESAIDFAEEVGLLDDGISVNLENEPLPLPANDRLASVNFVVSTGCVGYVTEKTFERLLPAMTQDQPPWLANFVLRMFPFETISSALERWGYVTEKLDGQTFAQRKFTSAGEQEQVLGQLREQGIDPTGKESSGYLHADFYLSRHRDEAAEIGLERLLAA